MRLTRIICYLFLFYLPSVAAAHDLLELPPFERAVLLIKYYEALHDERHWPYIGYGHLVMENEPYRKGIVLNERQAEALLRHDLKKHCRRWRKYGADSLLLACVSYNCGPACIEGSKLLKAIESGEDNILLHYLDFSHYRGKIHPMIRRRRMVEYRLLHQRVRR